MALATLNSESPKGGIGLSGGFKQHCMSVTAPAGVAQTSFTVTAEGVTTESKIIGIVAAEATARAIGDVYVTPSANLLTVGFASQDIDGTEVFHITYQTR